MEKGDLKLEREEIEREWGAREGLAHMIQMPVLSALLFES